MKPLNTYIVCKEIENNVDKTESGFEVKSQNRFKNLKVVASSQDDIKVDDVVKVSIAAGEVDEDFVIIKRGDIIYII